MLAILLLRGFPGTRRGWRSVHKMLVSCSLFLLWFLSPPAAQAQDKIELFGGFSYARTTTRFVQAAPILCPITGCPPPVFHDERDNLEGWEGAAAYKPQHWLGIVADFSGHYGSISPGNSAHLQTYLFGPQVSLPSRVSPFAHILLGGAHESLGSPGGGGAVVLPTSFSSFASAVGAGMDIRATDRFSVRLFQVDYLVTRRNGGTQNGARISTGLVFHF